MIVNREKLPSPGVDCPVGVYPWLVVLGGMILYGVTLNGWVTFGSLPLAARIMGWDWHPGPLAWRPALQQPFNLLLSLPLRCLPEGWRVVGLNLVSAICAALTLGILVRSIRLFSHDRTREQRQVVRSERALLPGWAALLPCTFGVLLLAAQLTFWENAVLGTGEMIDLLVFAFLILCLLEFRVSGDGRWLSAMAFVYGVGVSNDWALIGYFPCFLLALIWIKGIGFFDPGFVLQMVIFGALGLTLDCLMPLVGVIRHEGSFWGLLHAKLGEQHYLLTRIRRYFAIIAAAQTLVPLCFAGIRWSSSNEGTNQGANSLNRGLFRIVHLACLAVAVLMFFDTKASANPRNMGMGVIPGTPCFLTFYYLAALCVGYFSGYVLLTAWGDLTGSGRSVSWAARVTSAGLIGVFGVAVICLPVMLFCSNRVQLMNSGRPVVARFGEELAKSLPAKPAVVLSEDPLRLYLTMAACRRLGLPDQYVFVEAGSLVHREYLNYLADRYPSFGKELIARTNIPELLTDRQAAHLVAELAQRQPVYYLHPSFGGICFEEVCMTPYRLGGMLHPRPTNLLANLELAPAAMATNQAYWRGLEKNVLGSLPEAGKTSNDARRVADYYSQILDYWGTELQKTGTRRKNQELLEDAGAQFSEALRLNPNNLLAQANEEFNALLRGAPAGAAHGAMAAAATEFYGRWNLALGQDGPADVPILEIEIGRYLAQGGAGVQAATCLQRCLELAPDSVTAELDLANCYIDLGLLDAAFALIKDMRNRSAGDPLELAGVEALGYVSENKLAEADRLLMETKAKYPNDAKFPAVMAELYRQMGYRALRQDPKSVAGGTTANGDSSAWFQKSLRALDESLQMRAGLAKKPKEAELINLRRTEMEKMITNGGAQVPDRRTQN